MALGVERSASSLKQNATRPSASVLNDIDDLYENNAFDDDQDDQVPDYASKDGLKKPKPQSRGSAKEPSASALKTKPAATATSNNAKQLDFSVWVARKDKYERIAAALAQLNTERASSDEQWLELAVSLAATDCLLKTGKSDKCDCAGVCRDAAHSVTKQRSRCQCPAKKCSLCRRCVNTSPGAVTEKMVAALSPYRLESSQTMLSLAELIAQAGEGQSLQAGKPKITTAVLRMAQTVLAQCSILENDDGTRIQRPCSCPVRSLGDLWVKWTTRFHTFSRVPLKESEAAKFSSGTRQMMEFNEKEKTYFMTLKWHQAAKPQKGDTAKIAARRMLTADQKKQNAFFLGLCKKYWTKAQHRVVEHLQEKMGQYEDLSSEKRKKLPSSSEMELLVLNRLGVQRIMKWLEEDQEAIEEKKSEEVKEKTEGGVVAHNAWVKRKDRLRIRMPTADSDKATGGQASGRKTITKPGGTWKPPRFDFSSGKGVVRKNKVKVPSSTVELMKESGLKYVHAMSEGFQGRGGDLEKCKQLLVKKGHILRANFDSGGGGGNRGGDDDDHPFSKDRYLFEKEHNPVLKKKKESEKFRQEKSKESYEAWIAHKALKDRAVKFLHHIPRPSGSTNGDRSPEDGGGDDDTIPASVRWEEVGKALKAVDRGLLDEWVKWSDGFKSAARCRMLWESFTPISCDVHCTSSAIRDVFLKLLHRKGINYKKAFLDHCDRKHKKLLARGDDDSLPEEMTDDELMERFAALNIREFTKLLLDLGIVLQPEETQRLLEYFDTNGDHLVSMKEFLDVVGEKRKAQCHGDTDILLRQVCMWETVCHECGMLNAFQLVIGNTKPGSSRMRSELPGHIKRREQSARFDCDPECDMRDLKGKAPKSCAYASWTDEKAAPFVKKLELWSAEHREQRVLQQLVTEGFPPDAPTLFRDDDEALDPTTQILLRWHPPPVKGNNGVAFYILETIGAEGTQSFRLNEYREVYRDPKDYQDNNGEPRYHYVVSGLPPNTKFGFRIRALNGFGAGPYTFGYFFTAPSIPPAPLAIRVGANSIHLGWESSSYYRKQLRELRQVFEEADADGNGLISRDEFMEEIERRKPRLLEFLQKTNVATSEASGHKGAPLSIFDAIETDDNECISWDEFLKFFHGFLDDKGVGGDAESSTTTSRGGLTSSASMKSLRDGANSSTNTVTTRPKKSNATIGPGVTQCRYILKQCSNEASGEYVEIYRGTKSSFVVHGLASGSTYQFRVQAYNEENMFSLHSEPVVVNTLLQTPSPPSVAESSTGNSLTSSAVKLKWAAANARPCLSHEALQARSKQSSSLRKGGPSGDDQITRILKEWAQETSLDDGCVDFRAKFDRYDADKSSFIELPEFKTLLEELGVPATEERLAAYMEEFDTDSDGKISFQEFTRWWNKTDVQYVLKRDSGRQERSETGLVTSSSTQRLPALSSSTANQMSVVSYRGKDTWTIVNGLEANTQYAFRLRIVSSHASSQLSDVLEVWSAPHAPSCAGVICAMATTAQLCWYPGVNGAHRFVVECKFVETLVSGDSRRAATVSTKSATARAGDWTKVYEGAEALTTVTDLVPNTVYRVRVFALNRVGIASEQSTVAQFCTQSKDEERATGAVLRPLNAADHFTVECCEEGDIVAGDTILFSERIVRSETGKIIGEESSSRASGATASSRGAALNNASVYSVASFNGSTMGGGGAGSEPIGERTVAARVVSVKPHEKYGNVATMVVVWCTVQLYDDVLPKSRNMSAAQVKALASKTLRTTASIHSTSHNVALANPGYTLAMDLKISRKERSLYRYDTFRKQWQDERARHPSTWDK